MYEEAAEDFEAGFVARAAAGWLILVAQKGEVWVTRLPFSPIQVGWFTLGWPTHPSWLLYFGLEVQVVWFGCSPQTNCNGA